MPEVVVQYMDLLWTSDLALTTAQTCGTFDPRTNSDSDRPIWDESNTEARQVVAQYRPV